MASATAGGREHSSKAADTIIVPLDGSDFAERALVPASALSARMGAEIVVMTSRAGGPDAEPEAYLADAAARAGIPDAEVVASDDPVVHVVDYIVRGAARPVICMTTHGRSGLFRTLLGSVAEEVTRRSRARVLLVGPAVELDVAKRFDTAVVCTDGSDISNTIVPVVSEWISALHLRSWVVEVLDPDTRRVLDETGEALAEESQVFSMAQALMNRDGKGVNWEVLHGGGVASSIVDYAARLPASMIAMATHGRTGLGRLALGSVAATVVHDATCPVLVARPSSIREE